MFDFPDIGNPDGSLSGNHKIKRNDDFRFRYGIFLKFAVIEGDICHDCAGKGEKYKIESLDEIFNYADQLIEAAKRYL